jgi:hypothetical protein
VVNSWAVDIIEPPKKNEKQGRTDEIGPKDRKVSY